MLGKNKKKGNENANKVTKAMILQAQMAQMEKSKKKSKKNSKVVEAPVELEENINKLGNILILIPFCKSLSRKSQTDFLKTQPKSFLIIKKIKWGASS